MRRTLYSLVVVAVLAGCHARLGEPPVDLVVFQLDYDRGERRLPRASLPVRIGLVRVGHDARSRHDNREQDGGFSVVEIADRDVAPLVRRLAERLGHVEEIVVLQPGSLGSSERFDPQRLRRRLAEQGVDLALVYNATATWRENWHFGFLALLTLGLIPNATAEADGEVRAALIDVATGYIFQTFTADHHSWGVANAYTLDEATEQAADRSKRRALANLLRRFEADWPDVSHRIATLAGGTSDPSILPRPQGVRYETVGE